MKIFDPKLTGSIEILNTITGDVTLAGNLNVEGALGGAVTGSATASYIDYSNIDSKPTLISGSAQIATDISGSSTLLSSSLESRVSDQESFSSSLDSTYATDAQVSTAVSSLNAATSSYALENSISGSFTSLSSSLASELLKNTTDTLTGDLTVTGTLTAQEFHTEFVSASIMYDSGSTKFGDTSDDIHNFTGSLNVLGDSTLAGSLQAQPWLFRQMANQTIYDVLDNGTLNGPSWKFRYDGATGNRYVDFGYRDGLGDYYEGLKLLNNSTVSWRGSDIINTNAQWVGDINTSASIQTGGIEASGDVTISKAATPLFKLLDTTNNISLLLGADDANTFIRSSSSANLYLQPGGSTALTLLSGGNVGIGDTSPSTKIDVYQSTVGIGAADFRHVNGNRILINPSYNYYDAYNHIFRGLSGTTTHMTIDLNGNVGIGTTTPSSKLTVEGAPANGTYLSYLYNSATHNSANGLNVQTSSNNILTYGLRVNTAGDSNALAVMGNGKVGIGTSSPGAKLEIDIGVDEVGLGVFTTGESTTPNVRFGRDDTQYIGFQVQDRTNTMVFRQDEGTGEHSANLDLWTSTNGDKYFRINNNDQSGNLISNWLTIKNSNVGIGTTSPSKLFSVIGYDGRNSTTYLAEIVNNDNTSDQGHGLLVGGGNNANHHLFQVEANGSAVFAVKGDGKVGIGTTSPAEALQIVQGESMMIGDYFFLGSGSSSYMGSMGFNRDTTNGNIFNSSYGAYQIHNYQGALKLQVYSSAGGTIGEHKFFNDGTVSFFNNVGIGTASPTTSLTIQGTTSNGIIVMGVGTTATRCYLGLNSANKGYLFIAGSSGENPAVITSQGDSYISTNLGIGTTSPAVKLHVVDTTTLVGAFASNNSTRTELAVDNTSTNNVRLGLKATPSGAIIDSTNHYGSNIQPLIFQVNASDKMLINSSGRVDIEGNVLSIDDVDEYREEFFTTGQATPSFDITMKNVGASGQPFEVFVGWTHYATGYGCMLHQAYYQRSTAQSDITLVNTYINQTSTLGGAWSVAYIDATTVRVSKSSGTSGGNGYGYIRVTKVKP